ncbi:MAG: hypothetical protein GQ534_06425, partial [Candidatus Delongbacteria bacterium]|nr:hypothetical protein [Candidatus Delongbacteria bacterium]
CYSKIFQNDSGTFTDINAGLIGSDDGSVAWGDYDNDGDLDILLAGRNYEDDLALSEGEYDNICKIYLNDSGIFTTTSINVTNKENPSLAWGDYDNDGDLDITITSGTTFTQTAMIYRNNGLVTNTTPNYPTNLFSIANGSEVALSWDKATDTETPQYGLSYNLYLGTSSLNGEIQESMSDISNGYRKVVSLGNTNQNNSWTIKDLQGGTYYWSVQAIDHAFAGSEFSAEQSFTILGIPNNVNIAYSSTTASITWDPIPEANSYKVFTSTDPYGTYLDFSNFGTFDGASWSLPWSGDKLFFYVIASTETGKTTLPVRINKVAGGVK